MTPEHATLSTRGRRFLARQLAGPSGPAGHLVTRFLARGNATFNRRVVHELSEVLPAPLTVIELGCGPGIALRELLTTYRSARVIGIDPSVVALKSARRRNAGAIEAGRLTLITGDLLAAIEYGPADLILACHVLYFWAEPLTELQRARQALGPAGHLALGYQLRRDMPEISQHAFLSEGFVLYDSDDQLITVLTEAGFATTEVRVLGEDGRPAGRIAISTQTEGT